MKICCCDVKQCKIHFLFLTVLESISGTSRSRCQFRRCRRDRQFSRSLPISNDPPKERLNWLGRLKWGAAAAAEVNWPQAETTFLKISNECENRMHLRRGIAMVIEKGKGRLIEEQLLELSIDNQGEALSFLWPNWIHVCWLTVAFYRSNIKVR